MAMDTPETPIRLIDLQEVMRRTGLKRDSIYRLGKLQRMPRPVKVSEWASRWVSSEIDAYIAKRMAERDALASRAKNAPAICAGA
jgi:prophage regulatory protein